MSHDFSLKPSDINWAWHSSRIGARKKLGRASAAVDTSSWRLILTHTPTGVEISGEIPMGHYSNKQMQAKKQQLWNTLHEELKQQVAKHLKLPGR